MNVREKLVELLKCNLQNFQNDVAYWCEEHILELASCLIANGVTVQEWISVKDRLPDTAERVLVCKTWNGRVYKPEYGYYQDFPKRNGCWYVLTEFGYYPQREVTHWMPMPQPPKGE
jgi:hypothetical protein